jgi:tetratricopeptide (TPR) repeat protein
LSAGLVFLCLRQLLVKAINGNLDDDGRKYLNFCAAAGALFWALHPLRVEAVAWVAALVHCQAVFFMLLSLWLCLLANDVNISLARKRVLHWGALLSSAASMLTFPVAVGLAAILVILDFYPLRRLRWERGQWRGPAARHMWWEKLPYAAVTLLVLALGVMIRFQNADRWGQSAGAADFGQFHRFMQAVYVWGYYLWKSWLPAHLTPYYTQLIDFSPASLPFLLSAVLLVVISGCLLWRRHRWPWLLALWIFHLAVLFPMCGWTENPHFPSDRYSLMSGIIWAVLLAAGLWQLRDRPQWRAAMLGFMGILVVGCAVLSNRQLRVWNNGIVFFEHLLRLDDQSGPLTASIYYRLGACYLEQNSPRPAEQAFRQAIALEPNAVWAHARLGAALHQQGRFPAASVSLRRALELAPGMIYARENLARILIIQKKYAEAEAEYRKILEQQPHNIGARQSLAMALLGQGKVREADAQYAEIERLANAPPRPAYVPILQ